MPKGLDGNGHVEVGERYEGHQEGAAEDDVGVDLPALLTFPQFTAVEQVGGAESEGHGANHKQQRRSEDNAWSK